MKVSDYNQRVRQDHSSATVRGWYGLYAFFWFHTEVWLKPLDRRPYTFIMRDLFFPHMAWFWICSTIWFAGLFTWLNWQPYPAAIIIFLTALLWAHLKWGAPWVPGEQEDPQIEDC
jgi:hypothetical protein